MKDNEVKTVKDAIEEIANMIIPNVNNFREQQMAIAEKLILAYGVTRSMNEISDTYVKAVIYKSRNISIDLLLEKNEMMKNILSKEKVLS
jgi:hypothetical protein